MNECFRTFFRRTRLCLQRKIFVRRGKTNAVCDFCRDRPLFRGLFSRDGSQKPLLIHLPTPRKKENYLLA